MTLDGKFIEGDIVVDKYHAPLVAYEMTERDYVLRPDATAGAIIVTLPPVALARGRFYSIVGRNLSITETLTITDQTDSEQWEGDIVCIADGQGGLFYSDGLRWMNAIDSIYLGVPVSNAHIHIANTWGESANIGAILVADDAYGTALALGAHTTEMVVTRVNVTATITNNSNFMANYTTMATAGAMADGFIIGHYIRVNILHQAFENYAIWGRMNVTVEQTANVGNQYLGVFGSVAFAAGGYALLATGGGYGVLGTASIAAGSTFDQPLLAGYFDCNPLSDIAGETAAIKGRMQGYTDWGLSVLCQTSLGFAGVYIRTQDAAILPAGIKFEANATGGVSYINHAFWFLAADMTDGAYVAATAITTPETAQGVIKIDCAGTNYYVPFYNAADIDTEWVDF